MSRTLRAVYINVHCYGYRGFPWQIDKRTLNFFTYLIITINSTERRVFFFFFFTTNTCRPL